MSSTYDGLTQSFAEEEDGNRIVSIHCPLTVIRRRNLSFFRDRRMMLNVTSSNNIVGHCQKKLAFTLKENGSECFSTVSTMCATAVKNLSDEVSAKSLRLKNLLELVRNILPFI